MVTLIAFLLPPDCFARLQCQKCNYEWCWLCNRKYQVGHFKNGACEQVCAAPRIRTQACQAEPQYPAPLRPPHC